MENLIFKSKALIQSTSLETIRDKSKEIGWESRLIGILGARGTGKTTLVLQQLKLRFGLSDEGVYWTMDDIYFTNNTLIDTIEQFRNKGGKLVVLDEVHKYPDWAKEIKNGYDFYKDIQIIFTGSSIIDMMKLDVDLSRRAVLYDLSGLSFREFLNFKGIGKFEKINLEDLISNHIELANDITATIKPFEHFPDYLSFGYYPFFLENISTYHRRIEQIVKLVIETELQFIEGMDIHKTRKIHQLLGILAKNVPFKPNISKLSEKIGIHRNTLTTYIHYLEKARLINSLNSEGKSISILQKPEKIFLENTNLSYALAGPIVDIGNIRETFFLTQLKETYEVSLPKSGDFLINGKYIFEVGGKNKTNSQINHIPNAYIAADDISLGTGNKIPLWLFGFV